MLEGDFDRHDYCRGLAVFSGRGPKLPITHRFDGPFAQEIAGASNNADLFRRASYGNNNLENDVLSLIRTPLSCVRWNGAIETSRHADANDPGARRLCNQGVVACRTEEIEHS